MTDSPLVIDYYSDILCVWAWIAERRNEELREQWGEQIQLRHHFLNLFGDTKSRIQGQWSDRGGYEGFGKHVMDSAAPYENAPVNPQVWQKARPATSANAHLVLKAAAIATSAREAIGLELSIREAFFVDALDVGDFPTLFDIAGTAGLDAERLRQSLDNGTAAAALMKDYMTAQKLNITGSPSWVMNSGRQTLYGNVSYHVLHANIDGVLSSKGGEASWC